MPTLTSAADVLTRRVPKLLSSDAHRAADYMLAGSLIASGAWFWRRNRRAALGSWICGGSLLGLSLLTTYPGRNRRHLAFALHRKIETGMAAMIGAMPELLRFQNQDEKRYFTINAGLLKDNTNLTQPGKADGSRRV